ncbi:mitochondrial 39-S ribosomal protein L47 (MRP-L47)-domain-containing protein, partial [Vararia minispora EC-137]
KSGALRPHLGIQVKPNHGLWAFFRRVPDEEGVEKYHALDPVHMLLGRSWTAAELRRKSFKDLHTLWYVLARERNLLATQREAARRLSGSTEKIRLFQVREMRCRKSQAHIKLVLNERRLMYEGAAEVLAKE